MIKAISISLFVREYKSWQKDKPLARIFAQSESLGGSINLETSDNEVEKITSWESRSDCWPYF